MAMVFNLVTAAQEWLREQGKCTALGAVGSGVREVGDDGVGVGVGVGVGLLPVMPGQRTVCHETLCMLPAAGDNLRGVG